ncbi:hypothetical protein ONZ43_g2790 [Nemania bipapillata]|uniref:Uncharacterized protein n=1 Tax=Nemania bipapillata TaxID=110536 RepID=A0ACC2IZK5_9PEZI|nr:hypothetical protein ONZ43_g2790 [Nemania bipapillata]
MVPITKNGESEKGKRLPVTLLSGFLGSGKTTLLENILTDPNHGFRVGVIVNDVGALNIDAALLSTHEVTRKDEQVVAMQNGCICCTLRGDLLEEVARLAEDNRVDYLVIESSGVSEPMQVAETFSEEFAEMSVAAGYGLEMDEENEMGKEQRLRLAEILKAGGLSKVARLDTCVTMVDAVNFMQDFATADMLKDRQSNVPKEDDRNISDLQVDQVEFADVVVINKCDLVTKDDINRIKGTVQNLNPGAKVITSVKALFDLGNILETRMFSYEKAALSPGWLRSINEELNPETEEYGIGTFVYRARRPFHPKRLWEMIRDVFVVIQTEYIDEEKDGQDGNGDSMDTAEEEEDDDEEDDDDVEMGENDSDGEDFGEWSQAGVMLTVSGGDLWRCEMPESELPKDPKAREAILRDFQGKWGDRRQEIVFIGQQMRNGGEARLRKALDSCLLDDVEFRDWEKAMGSTKPQRVLDRLFEDGFEDWVVEIHEHDENDGHDHGHNHRNGV